MIGVVIKLIKKMQSRMKYLLTLLIVAFGFKVSFSQDAKLTLEQEYDILVVEWEKISAELKTYQGLELYCKSDDFKKKTINMLGLIHHYDSLVLQVLVDPKLTSKLDSKEQKATLKEIEEFESAYSVKEFVKKLNDECKFRSQIEKEKKYSKNDIGANSYDGQILLLETDLRKYIKHIDTRVEHIDDHLHKLHIDQVKSYKTVND